jgi:hypothetical protein
MMGCEKAAQLAIPKAALLAAPSGEQLVGLKDRLKEQLKAA